MPNFQHRKKARRSTERKKSKSESVYYGALHAKIRRSLFEGKPAAFFEGIDKVLESKNPERIASAFDLVVRMIGTGKAAAMYPLEKSSATNFYQQLSSRFLIASGLIPKSNAALKSDLERFADMNAISRIEELNDYLARGDVVSAFDLISELGKEGRFYDYERLLEFMLLNSKPGERFYEKLTSEDKSLVRTRLIVKINNALSSLRKENPMMLNHFVKYLDNWLREVNTEFPDSSITAQMEQVLNKYLTKKIL